MRFPVLRMIPRPLWGVALACVAMAGVPASAQVQPSRAFCREGRPAPDCRAFLVAEGQAYMPLAGSRYTREGYRGGTTTQSLELTWYAAWEVGGMMNVTADDALGATVLAGGDANGSRLALKGRYRHWVDEATALDVGAGVLRAGRSVANPGEPGNHHVPATGFTGNVSLGLAKWASVGVQADVLFSEGHDPATAYYLGTRLGTRPALVVTAVPLVLALVAGLFVVGSGGP
jgi:hypothetical protein